MRCQDFWQSLYSHSVFNYFYLYILLIFLFYPHDLSTFSGVSFLLFTLIFLDFTFIHTCCYFFWINRIINKRSELVKYDVTKNNWMKSRKIESQNAVFSTFLGWDWNLGHHSCVPPWLALHISRVNIHLSTSIGNTILLLNIEN